MYFVFLFLGKIISNIETIITANIIFFAHVLNKSIIYTYLYIIPLLDIFITNVVPIITITDIEQSIASNTLNIFPI